MMTRRTWRTMAGVLLGAVVASSGTTATAAAHGDGHQVRYCTKVDAYRIQTCARAILPATPVSRQLSWVLDQLSGGATGLTEAEVREHVSAEFLTVVMSPQDVIGALQGTLAEQGRLDFIGFSYPPRTREALAIVRNDAGQRGAVAIGVTTGRPALIESLGVEEAPPTIVPRGRLSGWFDVDGRQLFLRCSGHRSPTVVFEGGLTSDWYQLQDQMAPYTRVCSYDHPGGPRSRSDLVPGPRTARDFVADLHTLLRVARVPGPYVLAGISNGGLYTQLYASSHPRQVAGLVLIDAVHPAYHKRRVAMLKPLLPPEVWEAFVRESMTLPHPLQDPEQIDIWTANARPAWPCDARRCGRCRWSPSPTAAPPLHRPAGRWRRTSGCGASCNTSSPRWSLAAGW